MNKIILKGNIGQIPRFSVTQQGKDVCTFSLATNTNWKDLGGEWQTHTDWHRIVVFRKDSLKWMKDILKKGDTLYIEGQLVYHQYQDQKNQSRIRANIVVSGNHGVIEYIRSPLKHAECPKEETPESEDILNSSFPLPTFSSEQESFQ